MPLIDSGDGRYLFAIDDAGDTRNGKPQSVVYRKDGDNISPIWDRHSYEAGLGLPNNPAPNPPNVTPIPPIPHEPSPVIPSNPMRLIEDVNPIGMAYWRNINYHAGRNSFMVALSIHDQLRVLTVAKNNLVVMDDKSLGINHTGEGIFFSMSRHDILYVPLDNSLIAVNVYTGDRAIMWQSNEKLWQMHSNYNENVFSATLKDDNYNITGWGVYNGHHLSRFPLIDIPDECQIDKSGEWLLAKEKKYLGGDKWDEYNRIIHVASREEKIVHNEEGAAGHSDNGFGCVLGENDFSNFGGALDLIDFASLGKRNVFYTGIWNMGYFSFTNAKPGPIENQFGLLTSPNDLIKVRLDGSGEQVVCPNLTQSQEYEHRPKANLCPLGEYAVWTALVGGVITAFVVRVP